MTWQPKVCAVCGIVLDYYRDGWVHTQELVGIADHVAVPVDYDDVRVRVMCDFCYAEVPKPEVMTVPAGNFTAPPVPGVPASVFAGVTGSVSVGNWAACTACGALISRRAWGKLTARAARSFQDRHGREADREWLSRLYAELARHMTGEVRPWQPGDEQGEQ